MNRETYQCDQKMINALLYDIWITSTCTNVWFEIFKKTGGDKSQTNNVDFAFLATRGKILARGLIHYGTKIQVALFVFMIMAAVAIQKVLIN